MLKVMFYVVGLNIICLEFEQEILVVKDLVGEVVDIVIIK